MLGEAIKKYRKEKDLSQKELAKKCNISTSYIQQIELGQKKNPSVEILMKICKELDVSLLDLITDSNNFVDNELYLNLSNKLGGDSILYLKPSQINKIDYEHQAMELIESLLRSKYVQEKYHYNYMDLTREDFMDVYNFLLEMLELKLSKIKNSKSSDKK